METHNRNRVVIEQMKPVKAVVVGAGARGSGYAVYAHDFPDRLQIVGVIDPRRFYRERIQKWYNIPSNRLFESWEDAAKLEKFADCVLICTPDRLHKAPAVTFAKLGYHILLEKPMAVTYEDCVEIVETCEQYGTILAVCHVLRYTPQARKIKQLISSGAIGDVVNIQHLEPVGFWHFAHSYVRGNWRNESKSTCSLLAKSCHDIDLISYWMGDQRCTSISSFGSLKHFNKLNKPEGASSRCLDCKVESKCPYSAKKIYLDPVSRGHKAWPVDVLAAQPDIENITEALNTGPYGKCVYDCDNDVMDNQVVNMQFEGGATVSFSMVAFTEKICQRQVKIFGTMGEITCDFSHMAVYQYDFRLEKRIKHEPEIESDSMRSKLQGHGGADFYAMDAFVRAIATNNPSEVMTGPKESLQSHMLTFAAERSRLENRVMADPESVMIVDVGKKRTISTTQSHKKQKTNINIEDKSRP